MKRSDIFTLLCQLITPVAEERNKQRAIVMAKSTPWKRIIAMANHHGMIPALYVTLRQQNLLYLLADKNLRDYLQVVYETNRVRNEAILRQLQDLCDLLHDKLGIEPVLLKGAAALSEHHVPDIGSRTLLGIDVMVPEAHIFEAIELLKNDGYDVATPSYKPGPECHHYARLRKNGVPASLELHRRSIGTKAYADLPNDLILKHLRPSQTVDHARVIAPTFNLYHAFLHSEIVHEHFKTHTVSLIHLRHFAVISGKYRHLIDWGLLKQKAHLDRHDESWNAYLFALENYLHVPVPRDTDATVQIRRQFDKINRTMNHPILARAHHTLLDMFSYRRLKETYGFSHPWSYLPCMLRRAAGIIVRNTLSKHAWRRYFERLRRLTS